MGIPQTRSEFRMHGVESSCRAQVAAMSRNSELNPMSAAAIAKSTGMYKPGTSRRYGPLKWAGLLRHLDRLDPSYKG